MDQVTESLINNVLILYNNTIVELCRQITNLDKRINVNYARIRFLIEYRDNVVEDEERKEIANQDIDQLRNEKNELEDRAHELCGQMIEVYCFRDHHISDILRMNLDQNEQ